MTEGFFKFRSRFNFSPHPYEIGNPIFSNRKLEDNFFALKLYSLPGGKYKAFYDFHLDHYLLRNPDGREAFFRKVNRSIQRRIIFYSGKNPFKSEYEIHSTNLDKLEAFQEFLNSIDEWNVNTSTEKMLSQKDAEIALLKINLADLQDRFDKVLEYEASEKIVINSGSIAAFMDLMRQLRKQVLPNGKRLVVTQGHSPWYKMVAKNFVHGDKPISLATAQNYFSPENSSKHIFISDEDKAFDIVSHVPDK
ncbi:hypothetical protein EV200_103406 [Pedobacter psychrotolerans]|uniref:Uncharacterized protein n=1 Tax=Pedobacter psychrotolerans TaxID=1843235 RepID=A0A4R2HF18_9SPHI|nr:hypothetical protein [Pedobacter psychrotolerans]TCO27072.1 hypothetical protein EV200_103406 [Pedobacter psychrotolerans]GGE58701.1 hypothetical protein GCM10011413_26460 [Pedobacter psychrotolerans]